MAFFSSVGSLAQAASRVGDVACPSLTPASNQRCSAVSRVLTMYALLSLLMSVATWASPALLHSDTAGLGVWTLLVLTSGCLAWEASARLFRPDGSMIVFLGAAVVWAATVTCCVSYLGSMGYFATPPLLLLVGALGLVTVRLPNHQPHAIEPRNDSETKISEFIWTSAICLGVLSASVSALNTLRYTISDSDNMWYHLPMVAEWIRTGSIWPAQAIPRIARGYPGFSETLYAFLSLPIRCEHLSLVGVPLRLIFGMAICVIARQLGVCKSLAACVGVYALTIPEFFVFGNDSISAILISIALVFFLRTPSWRTSAMAGLCLGCLASTKYSGVIYAGLIYVAMGVWQFVRLEAGVRQEKLAFLRRHAAVLGFACIPAWPWYLRNLLVFENPIYPAPVHLFGQVLFRGDIDVAYLKRNTLGWDIMPLVERWTLFHEAFGLLIPIIAGACVVLLGLIVFKEKPKSYLLWPLYCGACFVAYLHQPFTKELPNNVGQLRYNMAWFVVSLTILAMVLPRGRRWALLASVLFLAGAVANLGMWTDWWWVLLLVSLPAAIVVVKSQKILHTFQTSSLSRLAVPGGLVLLALGTLCAATLFAKKQQTQYVDYLGYTHTSWGSASAYVHKNIAHQRVAVAGDNRFFPMYGDRLTNEVFLLPGVHGTPDQVVDHCMATNSDYLVLFEPAPSFFSDYPTLFEVVFQQEDTRVLRVNREK